MRVRSDWSPPVVDGRVLARFVALVPLMILVALTDTYPEPLSQPETENARDPVRAVQGSQQQPKSVVAVLPDDWSTQGQWPGRYGQRFWILCGMSGRSDYTGSAYGFAQRVVRGRHRLFRIPVPAPIRYKAFLGLHASQDDALRAWIHWPTLPILPPPEEENLPRKPAEDAAPAGMRPWSRFDVTRVLINPVTGLRRQADWDDHAEAYAPWFFRRGPHIYIQIEVPEGVHIVAFYFMNKDGDLHVNRFRDYRLIVKETREEYGKGPDWEETFHKEPTLAQTRVHQFRGGVYKRFFVPGPARLTCKIDKGRSVNTILQAIFLDPVHPVPWSILPAAGADAPGYRALTVQPRDPDARPQDPGSAPQEPEAVGPSRQQSAVLLLGALFAWRRDQLGEYLRDASPALGTVVPLVEEVLGASESARVASPDHQSELASPRSRGTEEEAGAGVQAPTPPAETQTASGDREQKPAVPADTPRSDTPPWSDTETWYLRLAQLYHDAAQFDLRDGTLHRLCRNWVVTRSSAHPPHVEARDDEFLNMLAGDFSRLFLRLHELPWLNQAIEQAAVRALCRAASHDRRPEVSGPWLNAFAVKRCITDPLESEMVFRFVEKELLPRMEEPSARQFSEKELYAAGVAARQQQRHEEAASRFRELLVRYPQSSERERAAEYLEYHERQAQKLDKLRYPDLPQPSKAPPPPASPAFDPSSLEAPPLDPTDLAPSE